ncbi:MAG: acylphosphatase [Mesorhizobium sp.]|uniref:acylphosphatase n=1 Tax=Mesorhizobium sp. TaxID=1871066 RepID=UPI0012097DB9|nr:acylphosphatase [Mesorhizobium sp.]TIL75261.1 MAG: acylphosphatase [Mesorhizobium sp.]TIL90451.1 MAG: acylphosphatase [Mesorhizobium sp.]TIM03176.1 MAG: acylphosphatase [Mesorhizobium sp.]TIM32282.1 MAG: acylphosphatase [Mesorhizobium sp.]
MEDGRKAVRVRLMGRVQGVSFRVWTRTEAERLGLSGWVRNEEDGSVTALIVGADGAVSTMLDRLWKGPTGASVSSVTSQDVDAGRELNGFRIIG